MGNAPEVVQLGKTFKNIISIFQNLYRMLVIPKISYCQTPGSHNIVIMHGFFCS